MCEQNEHQDTSISTMLQVKCRAQSEVGLLVGDVGC